MSSNVNFASCYKISFSISQDDAFGETATLTARVTFHCVGVSYGEYMIRAYPSVE